MISASVSNIACAALLAFSISANDFQTFFDCIGGHIADAFAMFEPIDEPETFEEAYYEPCYAPESAYVGGTTATTTHDLLNGQGRAYGDDGTSYTYYNHDIGYGALDIPGETFDSDGVSHDADGYIVVAADGYEYGEIIDTPYGEAKVYDSGSGYGNVDIYTNR